MTLGQIITALEQTDDELCIVAKSPWTQDASAKLVRLTDDERIADSILADGYIYFIEVSVARDEVLSGVGHRLTEAQRFEAVRFYAENDAYPEWLCQLRGK